MPGPDQECFCKDHIERVRTEAAMEQHLKNIEENLKSVIERFANHIDEAERSGGTRERMVILETTMSQMAESMKKIEKNMWTMVAAAGLFGGVIGGGGVDVLLKLFKVVGF